MKHVQSSSGFCADNAVHYPESKGKDERMILKDEVTNLRLLVVDFLDLVGQRIEMEAEKTRNALIKR
ncbi:hypothetical protein TorRG33x02_253530 [Trema orientale]|uniref:Uncharacterized protein n=1 Tax=Trema orientale TaxID=63057 RepID=A0A2P5DEP4_TREOI|nr:hypothetical protein TorRG33x02_253530 [Trema orientale]